MFIICPDCDLEAGEQRLREGVKGAAFGLRLVEVELATKQLHAEQCEDDEEEEEEQQQGGDRLHGVQQRCHEVGQGRPVSEQTDGDIRGGADELTRLRCVLSPCDLEDAQQADAAQHRDPQWRHDVQLHQDGLHDAPTHHEAVETIEERHEVMSQPETVHLQQHLHGKQ